MLEEGDEEGEGDAAGLPLVAGLAAGGGNEDAPSLRDGGQGVSEGAKLGGVAAGLEGVEVAPGCTGSGAFTAAGHGCTSY